MRSVEVKRKRTSKTIIEMFKIYGAGVFIFIAGLVIAYQFVEPSPPARLTIATASPEGAYYSFATMYKELFGKEGIELKVLETSGSVENLRLLQEKRVDVAFVQGGVGKSKDFPDLVGLASLYQEPLAIFVRAGETVTSMLDFAGKKLAAGSEGSGTRKIVQQLIADNGLEDKVQLVALGGKEAAKALVQGEVDSMFMVTHADAELVKELFYSPKIELVSLARAESYARLHQYLSHIVLLEGVLDMANNIPDKNYDLIAPAATLVAHKDMHPALVDLLMQVADEVHDESSVLSNNQYPSPENIDFPLSKEADRYFKHGPPFLQRYLPFWAASLIDRLKFMILPLMALLIPLVKVLPPTYRWRIRSRIYRWYDELHALDLELKNNETIENLVRAEKILDEMEQEVREVEVPLSYAEELYHLRLHMDLLRKQFKRKIEAGQESL